ncbi:DUF3397 domain-containing protein [Ornithinibacillus contaminans]|uniref:DUF3397 domain-containing protein n=1 Tax=Ornithinibacillus contaminans TaxID=694055 RepID=UPI00064DD543|nr:DUF3397 domain-containing protein [Ornithinibacillus contaminans]
MIDLFLFIMAFLITIPIFATVVVYYAWKYVTRNPLLAFHKAINWTTIFYVFAVTTLLSYLFGDGFFGYILLLILLLLTILIFMHWKRNTEVDYRRAFKLLWRLCFLLFFLGYVVLVLYGIIRQLFLV